MEALGKLAPDHGWYQLYSAKDQAISEDMIKRAGDAGLKTLVFTVDVPEGSNRERNARNGWGRPLKLTWKTKFEALLHPAWMMEWMKHGTPYFDNWAKYAGPGADAEKIADMVGYQNRAPMTWKHVERYRELWKGNFVLKGIMHPDDAIRAHSLGVDGLMVSNHGARQLDNAPSPLEVLPAVHAAVGDKMTLMLDGGVRRGLDAVIALCMGAKFVFVGRPTLYGVTAGGIPGAKMALNIFRREIDLSMAQMGAPKISDLGPQFLMWKDEEDLRRNRRLMRDGRFLSRPGQPLLLSGGEPGRAHREGPWLPLRLETDRQRRADGPPRRQSVSRRAAVGAVRLGLPRIRCQVLGRLLRHPVPRACRVPGRSRQAGAGLPGGRRAGRAGAVLPPAAAADLRRRRGDRR